MFFIEFLVVLLVVIGIAALLLVAIDMLSDRDE